MKTLTESRNHEFLRRCIDLAGAELREGRSIDIDSIIDRVLAMQPRSHYLNYDTASRRLHIIERRGLERAVASKLLRAMWQEIGEQVAATMHSRRCPFDRALSFVLNFCRPSRFYMTRDTARRILAPHIALTITRIPTNKTRC